MNKNKKGRYISTIYISRGYDLSEIMDIDDSDFIDEEPLDVEEVIALYEREQERDL